MTAEGPDSQGSFRSFSFFQTFRDKTSCFHQNQIQNQMDLSSKPIVFVKTKFTIKRVRRQNQLFLLRSDSKSAILDNPANRDPANLQSSETAIQAICNSANLQSGESAIQRIQLICNPANVQSSESAIQRICNPANPAKLQSS